MTLHVLTGDCVTIGRTSARERYWVVLRRVAVGSAQSTIDSAARRLSQCSLQGRIECDEKPGPVPLAQRSWAARIRSELPEVPLYLTAGECITDIHLSPLFAGRGDDARSLL